MAAPANPTEFLAVLRKSSLVAEDRLEAELGRYRSAPTPIQTVDQMASSLIRSGLLTRFQAKQIKIGRYKRFEIAGKYRLLELLGVGGMGAVYLCEHMFMKRLVALKVLPVEKLQDQSSLLRFYREARAGAALDHPNIVRAFDIDKFDQLHFLVMEFVDGTSMQEIVARNGPFSPNRAAHYAAQSALGLHHAHELGMVHRDIKPGNLLLERTGLVKVLDMGLARFFDQKNDNVTERFDNNCVLGTADYLAPEQAISNVVDIRADIYALGGSLHFMLTGHSPFPDGTVAHKLMCHQTSEPKPVGHYRKDVPAELLAVLHKMMRKNPAERYQSPSEVCDALSRWSDFAIPAPPDNEMPDLCPAVLALAGHAAEKSKVINARVLAGSRSGFSRGGGRSHPGSSAVLMPMAGSPLAPDSSAPVQSLVPTATSSSTSPIHRQPPPERPASLTDSVVDLQAGSSERRTRSDLQAPSTPRNRYVLLGIFAALILVASVVATVVITLQFAR